jgi:outer membrane protein TolC
LKIHPIAQQASFKHFSTPTPKLQTISPTSEIHYIYENVFRLSYQISPELMTARTNTKKSKELLSTALSKRFFPSFSMNLSQNIDINSSQSNGSPSSDDQRYSDWNFNMNLPIFKTQLSLELELAEQEKNLAENNLQIKINELNNTLKKLLGNYLTSSYQLLNLQNSIKLSKEHLAKINKGYELRDQTRLELLRAEANTKELESRLDLLEQKKDSSFLEFLNYSGLAEDTPALLRLNELLLTEENTAQFIIGLADTENKYKLLIDQVEHFTDKELTDFFMDNSLLSQKITLEYQLEKTRAKKIVEEEWPDLSFRGNYERKPDTRFSDFESEGNLSLILTVPLFSGGTLFSNIRTMKQAQQIAAITHNSLLRKTIHSFRSNRKLITRIKTIFSIQQIHLQQQQEIVELSLKSYKIKQTSMQDLLTSQNSLIDAKNALMETTNELGLLLNQFAWELGIPFPAPQALQFVD